MTQNKTDEPTNVISNVSEEVSYNYSDIRAQVEAQQAALKQQAKETKHTIFAKMVAHNVQTVIVDYSGGGDSGSIDCCTYLDENGNAMDSVSKELEGVIEDYAWTLLEAEHGGWEIDDGSEGTISFLLHSNKIILNHHSFYRTTDTTETTY